MNIREIDISCCLCESNTRSTTNIPEGWDLLNSSIDVEKGFCPAHQPIKEWAESNCPGCVGGWQDCGLWRNFAFSPAPQPLTEEDFRQISSGKCPRRVNGTFAFSTATGKSSKIDLSKQATTKSGEAFTAAIKQYIERYKS